MTDIILHEISKSYGNKTVFSRFSLTLQSGHIYRLSEPSGSGKTTLLRMLMGLEKPDGGSISGVPADISAVFQEDRLIEDLTVLENIALMIPGKADPALIEAHLNEIGLPGCAGKTAGTLSGGMKRRTAIVRAVLHPSELLLLDEPFTGLDMFSAAMTVSYLLNHIDGRTAVIASHIPEALLEKNSELILFPERH